MTAVHLNELTNMAQLTEEVGEVARIISRKYGEQSFKDSDKDIDLAGELSDVLFVLLCLANQTGVDLQKSFCCHKADDQSVLICRHPPIHR